MLRQWLHIAVIFTSWKSPCFLKSEYSSFIVICHTTHNITAVHVRTRSSCRLRKTIFTKHELRHLCRGGAIWRQMRWRKTSAANGKPYAYQYQFQRYFKSQRSSGHYICTRHPGWKVPCASLTNTHQNRTVVMWVLLGGRNRCSLRYFLDDLFTRSSTATKYSSSFHNRYQLEAIGLPAQM